LCGSYNGIIGTIWQTLTTATPGTYGKAAAKSVEEKENLAVQLALRAEPKGADSHTSGFEVAPAALHMVDQSRSATPLYTEAVAWPVRIIKYVYTCGQTQQFDIVGGKSQGPTKVPADAGVDAQPRRVRHDGHHRREHGGAVRRDAGHL